MFSTLTESQLNAVEAVAMDMSAAYLAAANSVIPLAENKIVHDRFHVMQHATEAVDKVRRREHRELKQEGDMRLSGTKYVWLTSQENLSDKQSARLEAIFYTGLETGKAWASKNFCAISGCIPVLLKPPNTSSTGIDESFTRSLSQ